MIFWWNQFLIRFLKGLHILLVSMQDEFDGTINIFPLFAQEHNWYTWEFVFPIWLVVVCVVVVVDVAIVVVDVDGNAVFRLERMMFDDSSVICV